MSCLSLDRQLFNVQNSRFSECILVGPSPSHSPPLAFIDRPSPSWTKESQTDGQKGSSETRALCKHEDPSLNAKYLLKKPGMSEPDYNPNIEGSETGGSQESESYPVSLVETVSVGFSERPCLKAAKQRVIEKDTQVLPCPPHGHPCVCTTHNTKTFTTHEESGGGAASSLQSHWEWLVLL